MKNFAIAMTAALLSVAAVSSANAQSEAGPILVDASVAAVEATIDETPMSAPVKAASIRTKPMDVAGAMPAATVQKSGSNAVAAIELERDGAIRLGDGEIDVRLGTLEDVEQGNITLMQPARTNTALELNDEIKAGDFYYGQDGNVYRFVGSTL